MQDIPEDTVEFSSHDKNYFASIPNCIFHIGLDSYEISTYCLFREICGEKRNCTKSNKSIYEQLKFSESKLKDVKKSLAKPREELGGLSLIKITSRVSEKGDRTSDLIQVVDIWKVNIEIIQSLTMGGVGRQKTQGGGSPENPQGGVGRQKTQGGGSPETYKQEQRNSEQEHLCKRTETTVITEREVEAPISVFSEKSLPFSKDNKKITEKSLSFPKDGKKDWSSSLTPEAKIIHDWAVEYKPDQGEKLDSGFITSQIKEFGVDRFYQGMEYCIESLKKTPLKNTFGGFVRKAVKEGWRPVNEKEKKCKAYAEHMAKKFFKLIVLEKYVKIEELSFDLYYKEMTTFEDWKNQLDSKLNYFESFNERQEVGCNY